MYIYLDLCAINSALLTLYTSMYSYLSVCCLIITSTLPLLIVTVNLGHCPLPVCTLMSANDCLESDFLASCSGIPPLKLLYSRQVAGK